MQTCYIESPVQTPPDRFTSIPLALVGVHDIDPDLREAVLRHGRRELAEVDRADRGGWFFWGLWGSVDDDAEETVFGDGFEVGGCIFGGLGV